MHLSTTVDSTKIVQRRGFLGCQQQVTEFVRDEMAQNHRFRETLILRQLLQAVVMVTPNLVKGSSYLGVGAHSDKGIMMEDLHVANFRDAEKEYC